MSFNNDRSMVLLNKIAKEIQSGASGGSNPLIILDKIRNTKKDRPTQLAKRLC